MNKIADRVFINAKIYSVNLDDTITRGEALAIKDDKIIYIGSNLGVNKYIEKYTVITDCNNKTILPGFCDAHMHFVMSTIKDNPIDFSDIVPDDNDTPDDIIKIMQKRIKEYVINNPDCKVIRCSGFDRSWFMGGIKGIIRPITRHDIDLIVNDRPVILFSFCMHNAVINTCAIEQAGLSKDTPETISGKIRRESDGYPDGYLQETYIIFNIMNKIPNLKYSKDEIKKSLLKSQEMFISKGYTLISDCIFNKDGYDVTYNMGLDNELKLRIDGVFSVYDETRLNDFLFALENKNKYNYKDLLKIDTVKYFVDGNLSMIEPFTKEYCIKNKLPLNYREPLLWNIEHLRESMIAFQKQNFNIHVHAMGDYGSRISIENMGYAYKYKKNCNIRNILAHCSYIKDIDKDKMGKSNIIASIQPKWESELAISTPYLTQMLGTKIKKTTYPNKSLLKNNIMCAYGSDFPIDIPEPFVEIQTAITRKISKNNPLYDKYGKYDPDMPSECVTLKDAVKAHTICGAYQHHLENITGSIEIGKSADFVLIDKDIESLDSEDLYKCNVTETIFKGKTVYKKNL